MRFKAGDRVVQTCNIDVVIGYAPDGNVVVVSARLGIDDQPRKVSPDQFLSVRTPDGITTNILDEQEQDATSVY